MTDSGGQQSYKFLKNGVEKVSGSRSTKIGGVERVRTSDRHSSQPQPAS